MKAECLFEKCCFENAVENADSFLFQLNLQSAPYSKRANYFSAAHIKVWKLQVLVIEKKSHNYFERSREE